MDMFYLWQKCWELYTLLEQLVSTDNVLTQVVRSGYSAKDVKECIIVNVWIPFTHMTSSPILTTSICVKFAGGIWQVAATGATKPQQHYVFQREKDPADVTECKLARPDEYKL